MAFINNKQYTEILAARRNGDSKAQAIIDRYLHDGTQDDLDRMINDFYGITEDAVNQEQEVMAPETQEVLPVPEAVEEEPQMEVEPVVQETPDISELLDSEMDGLVDAGKFEDVSFEDFLKHKKCECNKAKKNADYFKAFDFDGREKYLTDKKDAYSKSFDLNRRDIERGFNDMDKAIGLYSQNVGDLPDDSIEFNDGESSKAYDDIVDLSGKSHSFGRSWDDADNEAMKIALGELVMKYGKKNVQAALNIIKGDNSAYRDHRNNEINTLVNNYGKAMDGLLK